MCFSASGLFRSTLFSKCCWKTRSSPQRFEPCRSTFVGHRHRSTFTEQSAISFHPPLLCQETITAATVSTVLARPSVRKDERTMRVNDRVNGAFVGSYESDRASLN